jgi:transposase
MIKSYSLDLRRRVAGFVEAGRSCHAAAGHFEVSVAFVVRRMAALGTKVTPASISRWFIRQGYSFKKRCGPANKDASCARRAIIRARSASRACARSRTSSCFSMRLAPPPR